MLFVALIMLDYISQVSSLLYVAYTVLVVIIGFVLYFTFKNIASDKTLLVSTLKTSGIFLLTALVCYFVLSSGEETPLRDGNMLSAVGSKLVSAGLFMFYVLILAATVIMTVFGVKNMKK
jgi:cytochrome b561